VQLWQAGTNKHITLYWLKPFVSLHEVEKPLLEVVKHADLHWMEEVGLREVAHDTGIMSKWH
jgi:hypothetical protein